MTSPLRDLAARIEDVARQHPAYSQAWQVVKNCSDHLCALAAVSEANGKLPIAPQLHNPLSDNFKRISDAIRPYGLTLLVDTGGNVTVSRRE